MADLVRDDVRLRKVPRRLKTRLQLMEETRVEVNLAVGRAVERTRTRIGKAAARVDLAREQIELGRDVLAPAGPEDGAPRVFGVPEHDGHELSHLVRGRAQLRRLVRA